jgi:RNA recognition motif-containing protein
LGGGSIKESLPASKFVSAFWFYLPSAVQVPGAVPTKTNRPERRKGFALLNERGIEEMTNIFVGNLSYQTTQEDLQQAFSQYGGVERVNIVTDRDSGQPRGFAFVEMTERRDAETAIAQLNGAEMNGRALNVNEARPKPAGGGGGAGRGRSGGGGGRGGSRW